MRKVRPLSVFSVTLWIALALVFSGFSGLTPARAEDANALIKQFDKEHRQAQRSMFAGKNEQAVESLGQMRGLLGRAETADPNSPKLKAAKNKYKKLVKDLERRTGRDLGAGTTTVSAGSKTELAPKPQAKSMPVKKAPASPVPQARDADTLADHASDLLHQTEKDLFDGKNAGAAKNLSQAGMNIEQLRSIEPKHSRLPSLETKYRQLAKTFQSKATTPGRAAAGPAAGKTAVTKGTSAELPYKARKPFQSAEMSLNSVERDTGRILDPGYRGNKDQLIANAEKNMANAKRHLAEARQKAVEKGVASHPEFDRLATEIAASQKQLDAALGKYGQMQAAAAASADEVDKDVGGLRKAYNRYQPLFQKAMGAVPYYNDLMPLSELIGEIEAFEKNDRAALEGQLADFAATYGSTREEIDQKADAMGYSGEGRASYPYEALTEGIVNIEKTRELTADDILRRARDKQSNASSGLHDFSRVEGHERIRQWGLMAARFDPDNPRVKQFDDGLDAWIAADSAALEAKIDKASWPAQAGDSPADAAQLTRAAREFLDGHAKADTARGKAPRSIAAVVITGPWRIFKRNILGEPIQYGLPVVVGEQWAVEKDMDRIRAYHMSMLTEVYKGVQKAPPFIGAAVGDSFYVRPGKIK